MSTFSTLSGALSALYAQQRAMDVTGQNIANANTEGYSRQRIDMKSVGGSEVPAMYSVPDGSAGGVTVSDVARVQDAFLEARGRIEHAQNSYLADQNRVYTEVQQAFNEPSDTGLQAQLADVWSAWHDLSNNPGDAAVRTQVLARATTLTDTLHSTHTSLGSLFTTTREQLDAYTAGVNTTAQSDGSTSVYLGGSSLVNGSSARQIAAGGAARLDDVGTTPVALTWADNGGTVTPQSGQMASMVRTLNTVLPHYAATLDSVAANLAGVVDAQHTAGYDKSGNPGGQFFVAAGGGPITAANITVGITDPALVAAAATTAGTGGTLDGTNADTIANLAKAVSGPDQQYRQLIADLGVAGQTADRQAGIQSSLTNAVDSARQAQSGVNLDEEMTNLITYQRAYQAAARVMNTIDAALDTLINHTGS